MINNETIEQVKVNANIVDTIGAFVSLKRAGADYQGLCPFHNEKSPSFTVSPTKRIFKCFGCGKSGDAIAFLMDYEKKSYIEAVQWLADKQGIQLIEEGSHKKEYVRPVSRLEKVSQKAIEWFSGRGISNNTLLRLKITESIEWMPQFKKEVQAICFNYYRNEELVNIKFRGPQKSFKLAKDAELIFYNLDAIKGEKTAVIVEGEIDCLSLHEAAIYNSVSVPNGAGAGNQRLEYLDNCWLEFQDKERIILALDNDQPGNHLRDELARRLGYERCYIVEYPAGCKDINDVLVKHGKEAVKACIENAKPWPIKGVLGMDEMYPIIDDWYENGYPSGARTRIPGFDDLLCFAEGQLTTITGIPGHGKDEVTNWIMASLAQTENWRWGICGFEETPQETVTKLAEKYTGKAFAFRKNRDDRMSRDRYEWAIAMIDKSFFFVNPDEVETNIDSLLTLCTQLVNRFGINGMYFNPWNWIDHLRPVHLTETEYVSQALSKIIKWARKYRVHVIILAHTTKILKGKNGKYEVPTLYSISGSAHFFNKTHNGITVYRNYDTNITDVYVQKVKQSWYGQIGFSSYQYDTMTRQYSFLSTSVTHSQERFLG